MGVSLAIGAGLWAVGQIMNAVGQKKAGAAAKDAGEAEAQRLEYNAGVTGLQAADAVTRGAEEEQRFRSTVRGLIGSQRAGFAGQGVDVGSGSAVDVQADAAYLGELDALTIRSNAQREAWGYRVQGEDLRMAAGVARRGGQAAQTAARWNTASSILGSGSSLLLQRYGWDRRAA